MIVETIAEEPPVSLADGGVIRAGVDAELDELRELSRSGRQALAAIEERERQRTGIGVAEGPVQLGLWLLPRGDEGECEGGPGGLRAQADAGECGAVYDA